MTGIEIYQRTETYERTSRSIRLHAPEWKLLLAFDGDRSLADIAQSLDSPLDEALSRAAKFLAQAWIEEAPLTLDQYLKRTGTAAPPSGGGTPPAIQTPPPQFTPLQPPQLPATPASAPTDLPAQGPMRLSAVVDYIISLMGNTALGRLLVYRVFLRVPSDLLQAEGIASVRLVMLTSLGNQLDAEAMKKAGIEACVLKPVKQSRLFNRIAEVMSGHRPMAARKKTQTSTLTMKTAITPPANLARKPVRILLAEDNVINQKVALGLLANIGYGADVANNGSRCWRRSTCDLTT